MAIYLARLLQKQGFRVGLVSHGYGGRGGTHLVDEQSRPEEVGEEAWLLWQALHIPVVAGRHRRQAIQMLLTHFPKLEVLVADDILQHRAVRPHVPILLTHWACPYYANALLPVGSLRDLPDRARRIPVLIYTYAPAELSREERKEVQRCTPWHHLVLFAHAHYEPPYEWLTGSPVVFPARAIVFAGLARPAPFLDYVRRQVSEVVREYHFPDHYWYRKRDIERLIAEAQQQNASLITTEKDAARLVRWKRVLAAAGVRLLVVPVRLALGPEDETRLLTYLRQQIGAQ